MSTVAQVSASSPLFAEAAAATAATATTVVLIVHVPLAAKRRIRSADV
jgi:hypothetical protein